MTRLPAVVAVLLALPLLSGCFVVDREPDGPRLEVRLERDEAFLDQPVLVSVSFRHTGDQALIVAAPEECLRLDVWVDADGVPVFLDDLDPSACGAEPTTFRLQPGDERSWGPFRFVPGEHERIDGEPVFPGGEVTVRARIAAEAATWDTTGQAPLWVIDTRMPRIEVTPEDPGWVLGEERSITARFVNTAPKEFHYTSRNGCNDIEVYVRDAQGEGNETRLWPADGPYSCPSAVTGYTIQPGEAVVWEVVWDGARDGRGGEPYVEEGLWWLDARFGASDADWDTAGEGHVILVQEEEEEE